MKLSTLLILLLLTSCATVECKDVEQPSKEPIKKKPWYGWIRIV